ncbi:hypothetical protein HPB50_028451 [Hyalomma asiaticum]|nr:hypothetical protein HPB50_028451 [Hyalomma asiaticum]
MAQASVPAIPLGDDTVNASPTSSSASFFELSGDTVSVSTDGNSKPSCDFCSKEFSNVSNLRRHVKCVHGEDALQLLKDNLARIRSGTGLLTCDLCTQQPTHFGKLHDLLRHHVKEHGFKEEVESLVFDTMAGWTTVQEKYFLKG